MNEFLKQQDGTPIKFYLTSRIPHDWTIWILSHGGSLAAKPIDGQFIIFPMTDLLPDEEEHVAFFKSRDIPTVRLQWLSRMKRFERVTSWTQWALDPKYREEHLIEDHLLAAERCILGLTNVGEICKSLSRRFPHHPIRWFEEQLQGYRPEVVPSAAPPIKVESTMGHLPTPIASGHNRSARSPEENNTSEASTMGCLPTPIASGHNRRARSPEENNTSEASTMGHLPTPIPSGHNRSARSPEENNTSEALKDELSRNQPVEHPRSPTPLERYFDSPEEASSPAEAAAQLLRGIDLSEWEPTPSIHRTPHSDRPSDDPFGLWYNSTEPMEDEDEDEDEGTLYKTQASRVRKDEDEYGWELLQKFIRISTWTSPAQLGRQINRLFHAHGGKRDWVQYLGEEANHKKVQDIRRKWRERHWRARNLDKAPPLFTFRQEAIDPAKVRASPPEVSSDELDQFTSPPRKRKTRSRAKTANTRQDSVLAPSPDDSSDSEKATQGRRKRRRPN